MGSSAKSQEIGSKRKRMNQDERAAKHIAWHASGYQGHHPQQRTTRNGGSHTPSLGRGKDFHVSGDRFFLTTNPYQQDVESRYIQDKKNGVITCLVCGKEGHYSCNCCFKDQEHKIVCTVCSKNGHCSMWCCQQNKSEIRACTRCGEIGHSTNTHGLGCSSCDEYGECRLSQVKCFLCESQDHYLARCPWNSILTEAFQGQRENFQAALRLALSKQGNPSSTPAKCSARSEGEVLTANKSSPICFTCREEGHSAFQCPQNSPVQFEIFEENSTIATSSNLSKELEEQDPGTGTATAKQSSEKKPKSKVRCIRCGEEGHRRKRCPLRYQSLTMYKSSPLVTAHNTPTGVVTCFRCKEEGHYARRCPQKHHKC
ncbi:DNA-binding protein HEXBP-like [Hordeum vulgare subsp. vulgare]|uniref:CCHC-type domain-containing protein n=1 Tax=Hordeum vulgare subsp. vulgare TaxID=112509 RepID=A0A8I7B828_HORVV|nr:DNA-binding protein HEXBP-like [Hordeum vulgare subsp. vulgare]